MLEEGLFRTFVGHDQHGGAAGSEQLLESSEDRGQFQRLGYARHEQTHELEARVHGEQDCLALTRLIHRLIVQRMLA
ncbi:MAG: hypothetical protein KatS3mg087_2129 [Patescibacteria group bacterium]|nr:MAG: hypothetical protein KatS3mg087_2129 [Patescibacteria group bacterium]